MWKKTLRTFPALLVLLAAGCGLLLYEEPEPWSEARGYLAAVAEERYEESTPLLDALEAGKTELTRANTILFPDGDEGGPSQPPATAPALRQPHAERCEVFAREWHAGLNQKVRSSMAEQERTLAEYTGFANMTAFIPATLIYRGLREKFDLVKHILGDDLGPMLDELEETLTGYGSRILEVQAAGGSGVEGFAKEGERLQAAAGGIVEMVHEHLDSLGNLVNEDEQEALEHLLDLSSFERERQEAEEQLQQTLQGALRAMEDVAGSPAGCSEENLRAIQDAFAPEALAGLYQRVGGIHEAGHETAISIVRSVERTEGKG